ncbi:hypothetical protein B0H66DRAFT_555539 [Apodospora peruviana]|uniref:Uncharacterized protein n=1 Tax=Apodospora peruviana TaxID=516989 RepID=A0AAE0ID67_9PEZI|nr:hypothetical protein B0H66DRAFT_555539 [Apodospora peruviana]
MERDHASTETLLDRENKLIADVLSGFRGLVVHGAEKVDNIASIGQAGYNSMAMEILMNGLVRFLPHHPSSFSLIINTRQKIKSTEDLLALTRRLRELWIVGPLKKPGDGDVEAAEGMQEDAAAILELLTRLRVDSREKMARESGGCMTYISGPIEGPPKPGPGQTAVNGNLTAEGGGAAAPHA